MQNKPIISFILRSKNWKSLSLEIDLNFTLG